MNRRSLSLIIIISTEIYIIIMLGFNCNLNQKDTLVEFFNNKSLSLNIKKKNINKNLNNSGEAKVGNIKSEVNENLKSDNEGLNKVCKNEINSDTQMTSDNEISNVDENKLYHEDLQSNRSSEYYEMKHELIREKINEERINYYDNKNYENDGGDVEGYKRITISNKKDIPVFKVATYEIKNNLTMSDKRKLLKVATKLNIKDYTKIKDFLYADNQKEGILNAIYLLEERLDEEDYQNVREIADRFVDMDKVEKNKKNWEMDFEK